jgi:hypothetical protein
MRAARSGSIGAGPYIATGGDGLHAPMTAAVANTSAARDVTAIAVA